MKTLEELKQSIIANANKAEEIKQEIRDEQKLTDEFTDHMVELYEKYEKVVATIRGQHTRFIKRYCEEKYNEEERDEISRNWSRTAQREFLLPSDFVRDIQYC